MRTSSNASSPWASWAITITPRPARASRASSAQTVTGTTMKWYGVRRLMLGGTSSKLVHEAPCPVLARGAEEDGDDVTTRSTAAHVAA